MNKDLPESIVILATTDNDAIVAQRVLQDGGFKTDIAQSLSQLCQKLEGVVGGIVVADESLSGEDMVRLQGILSRQESWSDLPIILMASNAGPRTSEFFSSSGNITLLERPFSRATFLHAVNVAMRARKKQYQVRDLLRQLTRATQVRDEFFATLSHELRTPLSVILGWIQILRKGNSSRQTIPLNAVEVLERNANVQKNLIDDLLDISRILSSKMHFKFDVLELSQLLRSTLRGFEPQAQSKGLHLQLVTPAGGDCCFISGDEQRLMQAISNLISNAIKFTPSGGHIRVVLKTESDACSVMIEDDGQGVDPVFLPSIFERLKQEDMSSTRSHGGLGLGLAITAHIVESHKGTVAAYSEGRGKGTKVIVKLPRANAQQTAQARSLKPAVAPQSLHGVKVLAVDDSPDILELLGLILKGADATVKLVDSADQALKNLDEFKPDVILSDIGMPNVDGYELIQRIRKRSKAHGGRIPAIALTAYARGEEQIRAIEAGFQRHLSKPIQAPELISAIASISNDSGAVTA